MVGTKVRNSLRSLFGFETEQAQLAQQGNQMELFKKYQHFTPFGYATQIYLQKMICGHCKKNETAIYRSIRFEDNQFTDVLQFEQIVENNAAKVVTWAGLTWKYEKKLQVDSPKECCDGSEEKRRDGKVEVVVKNELLSRVQCVKCGGFTKVSIKAVQKEGKEIKWYLCWKPAKPVETQTVPAGESNEREEKK